MDNIIYFTPDKDRKTWAEEVYNVLLEADKAVIAIKIGDEVHTGYFNCYPMEKQELVSHIQIDIIKDVIDFSE